MKLNTGLHGLLAVLCLAGSLSVQAAAVGEGTANLAKSDARSSLSDSKTRYRARLNQLKTQLSYKNLTRSEYNKQVKLAKSQYNSDVKRINLVLYKKLNGYSAVSPS